MKEPITPLRVRSGYSMLRGTALPAALVAEAGRLGFARLALTDINTVAGIPLFVGAAMQSGLHPIVGVELWDGRVSVLALVVSRCGYENLCGMITRIHDRVRQRADGNRAVRAVRAGDAALAADIAASCEGLHIVVLDANTAYRLVAGGAARSRLWIGVDPGVAAESETRCLCECSEQLGIPLVATASVLFPGAQDYDTVRLLAAIRARCSYAAIRVTALPPLRAVFRMPARLREESARFTGAIRNNAILAEQCMQYRFFPRVPVFPAFPCSGGESEARYLRRLCREGVVWRYGAIPPEAAEYRLDKELGIIERLGFAGYFLLVWDIVQYARRHKAPVAGRGSGGSSIVAYVLGITSVCPLMHNIPFERFLHEGRSDFPDLDVDFCWRIRDDVIKYVFRRWGKEHVAMVSMHTTFRERSALREALKAFGFSGRQVFGIIENGLPVGPHVETALRLSRKLIGLPRNMSVHPGGLVIGRKPICSYVPVQRAPKGVWITQFDKAGIEAVKLVKIDLLGNRSLSTIRMACELIRARHNRSIDIESLPPADPATIQLLQAADTVGCNQLESPAMRHLLHMIRPQTSHDVMKALALIRPGGAGMGMKEVFVRRFRGIDPVPTGHPHAAAILKETAGIMIYEDDVMMVAAALMDVALPVADRFRRAIQKCADDEARLRLSREFLTRCAANAVAPGYAKTMWVQMAKYNAYSFCRAHAASYSVLAYACVWLKAHYPLEFWCAVLNNNQSMYHARVYVEQAKRAGVGVVLPEINRSEAEFTVQGNALWVGLNRVKGLGPVSVRRVLEARRTGFFEGVGDFLRRTGLGCAETRALIQCGAFDRLGRNRSCLMMELTVLINSRPKGLLRGTDLFCAAASFSGAPVEYSTWRKYLDERRILGITVRDHIMALYRRRLGATMGVDSRALGERVGSRVRIAGVVEAQRFFRTRAGKTMLFLTLEDEYGMFEATVLPGRCVRMEKSLTQYGPYFFTGKVRDQYGAVTIEVQNVQRIEGLASDEPPKTPSRCAWGRPVSFFDTLWHPTCSEAAGGPHYAFARSVEE